MTTQLRESGWTAISASEMSFGLDFGRPASDSSLLNGNLKAPAVLRNSPANPSSLPVYETLSGFQYIGELTNEDKSFPQHKGSTGCYLKSHYSQKDGVVAGLFATEAAAPSGASLAEFLLAQQFLRLTDNEMFEGVGVEIYWCGRFGLVKLSSVRRLRSC